MKSTQEPGLEGVSEAREPAAVIPLTCRPSGTLTELGSGPYLMAWSRRLKTSSGKGSTGHVVLGTKFEDECEGEATPSKRRVGILGPQDRLRYGLVGIRRLERVSIQYIL